MTERLQLPADYRPDHNTLKGRQVLVTGASRGLGRAIACDLAAAGAQTILLARDVKALEHLADEILAAGHAEPILIPCNLEAATHEHYEEIAEHLRARLGHLDGVIFNAGMLGELSPLATYDPTMWARVFQVNLHSPFLMLRCLLPLLDAGTRSSILFVSSAVGRQARAYWGAYAASKFALEGMMQVLADELASAARVKVNSVNPGRCRTRMRAQAYPAEDAEKLPEPAALAPFFTYLLSPSADHFHGRQLDLQ